MINLQKNFKRLIIFDQEHQEYSIFITEQGLKKEMSESGHFIAFCHIS